jgi:small acid-soluble spore protein I (minor)
MFQRLLLLLLLDTAIIRIFYTYLKAGTAILWDDTIFPYEVIRMNLNLRHAIRQNVEGNSQDQLRDTILDAINKGEEKMLPGLGVLFEVIWENSSEQEKSEMLSTLEDGLK